MAILAPTVIRELQVPAEPAEDLFLEPAAEPAAVLAVGMAAAEPEVREIGALGLPVAVRVAAEAAEERLP
jgi:hypothetical protein